MPHSTFGSGGNGALFQGSSPAGTYPWAVAEMPSPAATAAAMLMLLVALNTSAHSRPALSSVWIASMLTRQPSPWVTSGTGPAGSQAVAGLRIHTAASFQRWRALIGGPGRRNG